MRKKLTIQSLREKPRLILALLIRKNTNYCPQIAGQTLMHAHIHVSLLFDVLQHYRSSLGSSFYFNE
jgi:hypothetical protein